MSAKPWGGGGGGRYSTQAALQYLKERWEIHPPKEKEQQHCPKIQSQGGGWTARFTWCSNKVSKCVLTGWAGHRVLCSSGALCWNPPPLYFASVWFSWNRMPSSRRVWCTSLQEEFASFPMFLSSQGPDDWSSLEAKEFKFWCRKKLQMSSTHAYALGRYKQFKCGLCVSVQTSENFARHISELHQSKRLFFSFLCPLFSSLLSHLLWAENKRTESN